MFGIFFIPYNQSILFKLTNWTFKLFHYQGFSCVSIICPHNHHIRSCSQI